jgi:hypothetical protein
MAKPGTGLLTLHTTNWALLEICSTCTRIPNKQKEYTYLIFTWAGSSFEESCEQPGKAKDVQVENTSRYRYRYR